MEIPELQQLAERSRSAREMGISLLVASAILALFLFVPLDPEPPTEASAAGGQANAFLMVPEISAKAAVVYDLATGKVLFAHNADAQLPLASLTKLLTVYAALEALPAETLIQVPDSALAVEAPKGLQAGETYTLHDLARLALTASLNDAATTISHTLASHTSTDAKTALASAAGILGLSQTYAVNGSGLDVHDAMAGAYGSALDMARLAGAITARAPSVARATTESRISATSREGTAIEVQNTDPVIGEIPGLLLSKTGYTELAGGNLALVLDVGLGHPVAVVLLGSTRTERFTDGLNLVAATFAYFASQETL